jgi:hypothetical protein
MQEVFELAASDRISNYLTLGAIDYFKAKNPVSNEELHLLNFIYLLAWPSNAALMVSQSVDSCKEERLVSIPYKELIKMAKLILESFKEESFDMCNKPYTLNDMLDAHAYLDGLVDDKGTHIIIQVH